MFFKVNPDQVQIKMMKQLSNFLKSDEFSDRIMITASDGMTANSMILFSNGNLVRFNALNGSDVKQRRLDKKTPGLPIEKNINKNDLIILQKIKDYR